MISPQKNRLLQWGRVCPQWLSAVSAMRQFASAPSATHCATQSSGTYRFTLDGGLLSSEQRAQYENNGYLVIRDMVSRHELEKYHKRFDEYASGQRKAPSPAMVLLREVSSLKAPITAHSLYKINELYEDQVLFEYCCLPPILDLVQSITGPNIVMINSMLVNKPPDVGTKSSRHPLHQDIYYFPFGPADRIVCAWTAMERVTRENGCLVVVPGSHKLGLLEHEEPNWEGGVNLFYHGVVDKGLISERVHLQMEPGDCVLFHSALIHGSGRNRTAGFRKAISAHYAPSEAHFGDISGTPTEKIAVEAMKALGKRFGNAIPDYATLWKIRSRLVRGEGGWQI